MLSYAQPRAHQGLACTESDALAAAMQKSPRAHDDSLLRACHAKAAYSSPCCLSCVSLRSQRWLRITAGNLTVLAQSLTSVHAHTWQSVQSAMTGVSVTMGHRGSCDSPFAEFCGRALYISYRPGQLPPSLMPLAKPQLCCRPGTLHNAAVVRTAQKLQPV